MKIEIDKRVSAMADAFAEREYETDGYEREWLSKGYYHGFMDAKKNLWHKATDPKDLPEIDREVIALQGLKGGGYRIVFAHRPQPSWVGVNIITGEQTVRKPKRYGKGKWNMPDVKWWLDIDIPLRDE